MKSKHVQRNVKTKRRNGIISSQQNLFPLVSFGSMDRIVVFGKHSRKLEHPFWSSAKLIGLLRVIDYISESLAEPRTFCQLLMQSISFCYTPTPIMSKFNNR